MEEKAKEKAEKSESKADPPIKQIDEDKQKLLQLSEISLILDTYDDIFSDFDPRPYSQRGLSEDFLLESRKASRDKASGQFELKFLIPHTKRNTYEENIIKKRLKDHFKKHFNILDNERKAVVKRGYSFVAVGILLMFTAALIMFESKNENFLINFMIVLLEPGGWFLFWEGLRQVIFESKLKKPDMEFYEKISKAEVHFLSY